jgi:hypothetical protein
MAAHRRIRHAPTPCALFARIAFPIALSQRAQRASAENTCIPEAHRIAATNMPAAVCSNREESENP